MVNDFTNMHTSAAPSLVADTDPCLLPRPEDIQPLGKMHKSVQTSFLFAECVFEFSCVGCT